MLKDILESIGGFLYKIFSIKDYSYKDFNILLLTIVYALGFVGIYLISILQDEDENMYQRQLAVYLAGLLVVIVLSLVNYHFIGKMFILLYLASLGLLLICRFSNSLPIYGWSHYDARRWIKIGGDPTAGVDNKGFEFQPAEITKIAMIIFLAKLFDVCYKHIKKIWVMLLAMVLMAAQVLFILIQPDLSTSIVLLCMFAVMLFASHVPLKFILPFVLIGVPSAYGLFWYVQQDYQVLLRPWQQNRILAMLHPELYPELMYQQTNAAAAIRSGGVIGKLLSGDTGVRGTMFVPVKESDFIFTAVCEEFGFIGAVVVILLYFFMILIIIRIARRAKDYLGMMIAVGAGALLAFQIFINIGVVTSILPNTGIALPFMSQGLSTLVMDLILIGILMNISMQPKEEKKVTVKDEFEELDL
ncbi:MAG: FtsW/RodA/SpoVE family cell cycle protein [Lachnospiraceae bacterium]|nr:FtsW/RodA/SpoVE family cell cycle protein [Lachnospiraceae bacterium]